MYDGLDQARRYDDETRSPFLGNDDFHRQDTHMSRTHLSLPYELRLGVTGHRALADPPAVTAAVDQLIDQISQLFDQQSHTPVEWVVVSPLAKGADRIVARSVLKRPGSRLEVVTPFSVDEYQRDFTEPDDLAEFKELKSRAVSVVELNKDRPIPKRSKGYRHVGKAMADSCEIVIAVWDGKPAGGHGGTGDIVQYLLDHKRTVLWINAQQPSLPPFLLVPGNSHDTAAAKPENTTFATKPMPRKAKDLSIGYHQSAAFARDNALDQTTFKHAFVSETAKLAQTARDAKINESKLEPIKTHLLPYYVRANELAIHYQRRHVQASKAVFFLSAGAVSVAVFQVLFFPHQLWLILFEVLAMIGAVVSVAVSRRQAWHEKWLHDRFLAEELRTSIFTLMMGEDPCVRFDHATKALPFYAGPKNWLLATVRRIAYATKEDLAKPDDFEQIKRFVIDGWLEDQQGWHKGNAKKKEQLAHRSRQMVFRLFCVTLAVASLHLMGVGHGHHGPLVLSAGQWITFFAIALPGWGAAVHGISKQMEYERIAARSEQMAQVLAKFVDRAQETSNLEELTAVVQTATHVIALENYEWWVLLSFAPPELAA